MLKKKSFFIIVFSMLAFLFIESQCKATILESSNIDKDTIWTDNDVHLVNGTININVGVKLTINPGTIVKFNKNSGINVNSGILNAIGESGNHIIFTSYKDDSFGGDTNEDGLSSGKPGDWNCIKFNGAVSTFTNLEYCTIRYGGSANQGQIHISECNISVKSCEISNSSSYGLYSYNASPDIELNLITKNLSHGIYHNKYYYSTSSPKDLSNTVSHNNGSGIYSNNATPEIINNQINNNDNNGIEIINAIATISENIITDNGAWGIYFNNNSDAPIITKNTITGNNKALIIPSSAIPDTSHGNIIGPNTFNTFYIRGNSRNKNLNLELINKGQEYEINTYVFYSTMSLSSGYTMVINPGVILKFNTNSGLDIHGTMIARGTDDSSIIFTSLKDDSYGGDTNLDAYESSPVNGDWRGIYFTNNAIDNSSIIDNALINLN